MTSPAPQDPAAEPQQPRDRLLTPGEVAVLFRVDPKTVTRWHKSGRFPAGSVIRTPGGHRRFRESAIRALLVSQGRQS